ncbi:DUF7620 family protein [Streptomyces galilaeus]|uniref:DUF7620 family protein n=1 Tax=Streptomyces galilaeus TaxID=33899 RepID=UPI0038F736A1
MIGWIRRLVHGSDEAEQTDSEAALKRAIAARRAAEARQPMVTAVAAKLRRVREENHFAEKLEALYRGAAR